uniref:Uncharacterized protein n=1 Tax=Chenopodium quinoa TaxID=63459 RepID=A0A803MHD4_CHEQI
MRGLATFAAALGLAANEGKSNVYFCNVEQVEKENIKGTSGFKEDSLPFKYLGVKVNAKKLSKDDCNVLIDKIVARIRSWGGRTMSYTTRTTLKLEKGRVSYSSQLAVEANVESQRD